MKSSGQELVAEVESKMEEEKFEIYRHNNSFIVIDGKFITDGLTAQNAKSDFYKKFPDSKSRDFDGYHKRLQEYIHKVDYFKPSSTLYIENNRTLTVSVNPTESWDIKKITPQAQMHIDDYVNDIWNGKLHDLINTTIYSMALKEEKKNKILVSGGSNKGKTKLFELMGFVVLGSKEFIEILKVDRVQSKETASAISRVGLILWDDAVVELPQSIKNVEDTITMKIAHGGNVKLPCLMLGITSTHTSLLDGADAQMGNRFLQMIVGKESHYFGSKSFNDLHFNIENYKADTENYLKIKILEAIEYTKTASLKILREQLTVLQSRYKVDGIANEEDAESIIIERLKEYVVDYCNSNNNALIPTSRFFIHKSQYCAGSKRDYKKIVEKEVLEYLDKKIHDTDAYTARIVSKTLATVQLKKRLISGEYLQGYALFLSI